MTADAAPAAVNSGSSLREAGAGRYCVSGPMTMATVTNLRSAGLRAFAQGSAAIEVDLGEVDRVDSGGLALLIDWLAWARAAHRAMKFSSLSPALLALAKLSNVEDLLRGAGQ